MNSIADAWNAAFLFFPISCRGMAFRVVSSLLGVRFVAWKLQFFAVIDGFLGQG